MSVGLEEALLTTSSMLKVSAYIYIYIYVLSCACVYTELRCFERFSLVHCKRVVFRSMDPANAEMYVFDYPTESITPAWIK